MMHGPPGGVSFTINKSDVWDLRSKKDGSNFPTLKYDELCQVIANQERGKLLAAENEVASNRWSYAPTFQPCGTLTLKLTGDTTPRDYQQRLSLYGAEATASFRPLGWRDIAAPVEIGAFVAATKNILAIRINGRCAHRPGSTTSGAGCVAGASKLASYPVYSVELARQWSPHLPRPEVEAKGQTLLLSMKFPRGPEYAMACGVVGGRLRGNALGHSVRAEFQTGQEEVEIFLAVASSADGPGPAARAARLLREAKAAGYDALRTRHRRWWRDFWNKSFISIEDKEVEGYWYFGNYILGSCSASGKQAPGLQGLWSNHNLPPWHGDYHADLNIQMNYWAALAANHVEQSEPLYRLYGQQMWKQMKKDAREYYGMRGIKAPCAAPPTGIEIGGWLPYSLWPAITPWIALHFWWAYQYTMDRKFLEQCAYPFFRECAAFYEDWLTLDEDGNYEFFPTCSPEQDGNAPTAWGRNSSVDIAIVKKFFEAAVEASELLGRDAKRRGKWQHILDHLPPYPTNRGYLIDMEGRDFRVSHRHLSRATPIYPAGDIGLGSPPAQLALGKRTLADIVKLGPEGFCGFSPVWEACLAARLGLGEQVLKFCHDYLDQYCLPNRLQVIHGKRSMPTESIMQIECTLAYPAGVTESLLQSHDGAIRAFPAVPKGATARFNSLRAMGGFLVSGEMEDGQVRYLLIKSTVGGALALINPFPAGDVVVRDLKVRRQIFRDKVKAGQEIRVATSRGRTYVVERASKPFSRQKVTNL